MSLTTGTRLGVYELIAQIGEGGMGKVFRARDTKLDRDVAIKILPEAFAHDADRLARFTREAKTLASLNHPNIAQIHGLEESGGVTALVMELVEGEDLSQRIARGAVPLDEALPIAKQIAEALEAAHEQGIIHRDLKPANIKVRGDGVVKVLDFGLAKALDRPGGTAGVYRPDRPGLPGRPDLSASPTMTSPAMLTGAGVVLGTAAYMSPEQARGKTVDKRADIWSFGAVLFEMLTGARAFGGDDVADVLSQVLQREPNLTLLPTVTPARIETLITRCLVKDPRQRLRDMGDVRLALDGAFETAASPMATSATPSASRGRTISVALSVVAIAGMLAMAVPALRHLRETAPVPQNYRFQVAPPPNTRFTTFRLSPDGRHVAFIATGGQTDVSGEGGLWLHDFDSLDSHQIPSSEGSSYPFWSPDGAFIGFFQSGKLRKIAAAGGPAQTICDVANSRGGAWGPDGTILFTDGPTGPIFRVPSGGGTPAQLTKLSGSDPSEGHRAPEFLPDGQHFLFEAIANKPDATGIYLGSLDGSAPIRLLPDDSNGVFVPRAGVAGGAAADGLLFFRRDGTLMALPFDSYRRRGTAEAFPVAQNVATAANQRYGAFSVAGNGTLAYWSGVGLADNRELVWVNRAGNRLQSLGTPNAFESVALSPDEKTVAASVGSRPRADIWLVSSANGSIARFTFGLTGSVPIWSFDGRLIVYARRNGFNTDIVRKQVAGGAEEVLLANVPNGVPRDVSPDGTLVVHEMSVAKTAYDIGLLAVDGDHRESVYLNSPANERYARFSPDGKWMAYQSDESGQNQVYVQTIPVGGGKYQISQSGGTTSAWRRDGRELFFLTPDRKLMAVPVKITGASFEFGTPLALFTATGVSNFAVTGDGQRFLMNVPAGGESAGAGSPLTIATAWQAGLKQ